MSITTSNHYQKVCGLENEDVKRTLFKIQSYAKVEFRWLNIAFGKKNKKMKSHLIPRNIQLSIKKQITYDNYFVCGSRRI